MAGCVGGTHFGGVSVENRSQHQARVHVVILDGREWLNQTFDLSARNQTTVPLDLPLGTYRVMASAGNFTVDQSVEVQSDVCRISIYLEPSDLKVGLCHAD